jgi:O-6-methylguanine DNA methyltransferase
MNIKSVSTPIGFFNSIYSSSGLQELAFLGKKNSKHPQDKQLQKLLEEFFSHAGSKKKPLMDLQGSNFQLRVWKALSTIPRGSSESYLSIAKQIGSPGAARAVGTACKSNPIPLFIPCHRVVKQDGSIGEFALGTHNKKYLLAMEAL